MMKAVFDTTSLNAVAESNHTCKLHVSATQICMGPLVLLGLGFSDNVPFEKDMRQVNQMDPEELKVQYKILEALYNTSDDEEEVINLSLLNDVPVNCMPTVLQMIQKDIHIGEPMFGGPAVLLHYCCHDYPEDALGRLWTTLRGWDVPALFGYGVSSAIPASKGKKGKRKRKS